MVGKWDVYYESNSHVGESEFTSSGEYYTLSNGERIDTLGDGGDDTWGVENDRLWVVSSGYSHAIYEMKDGYFLAVDSKGEADHIYKKKTIVFENRQQIVAGSFLSAKTIIGKFHHYMSIIIS